MAYKELLHLISPRLQEHGQHPLRLVPGRESDLTLQMSVISAQWFLVTTDELISLPKMYYEPHASRSNFTVLTSAHVTRTSLSKVASGEATAESVSFIYEGNEYQAFVEKEVIFSAGYAICSPRCVGKTLTCIWLF
jgi:hypothetical protein